MAMLTSDRSEQTQGPPNTLVVFDRNSKTIQKFKVEEDEWNSVPNGFTGDMKSWSFTAATVGKALLVFMSNKMAFRFQRSKSGKSCWMRLPDTKYNHGERPPVAVVKDDIYVIGSGGVGTITNKVEKYILPKDKWILIPPLIVPKRNHSIAVTDDAIYAIGGITKRGTVTTIEKLSMKCDKWEKVANLDDARHSAAAVTSGDDIFVLGGFVKGARTNDFFHITMPEAVCMKLPSMKISRNLFSAWIIDGKIYAVGGDNRQQDSVEVFDATKDQWELMDILSTLKVDAAVCMFIP